MIWNAAARRLARNDSDTPAFRRKFAGVGDEVDQDLLQRAFVGVERRRFGFHVDNELLALLARLGGR